MTKNYKKITMGTSSEPRVVVRCKNCNELLTVPANTTEPYFCPDCQLGEEPVDESSYKPESAREIEREVAPQFETSETTGIAQMSGPTIEQIQVAVSILSIASTYENPAIDEAVIDAANEVILKLFSK